MEKLLKRFLTLVPLPEYSEDDSVISCVVIDSVEFDEYEKKTIRLKLTSKFVGYLRIVGIAGKVSSTQDKVQIWGKLNFAKIPIKPEANQPAKQDFDRKLEIQILPAISALQVRFTDVPKEVLAGEVFPISIEITNTGPNEISEVYIATNSPRELILEPKTIIGMPLSVEKGFEFTNTKFRINYLIFYSKIFATHPLKPSTRTERRGSNT